MSGRRLRSAPPARQAEVSGRKKRGEMETDSSSDEDWELEMLQRLANVDISEGKSEISHGTGFIYDSMMLRHICEWDPLFPECPERISEPHRRCEELGLLERCKQIEINYATEDQIMEKHTKEHVELAKTTASMNLEELKALCEKYDSWFANKDTYEVALAAAGSSIALVDHILQDKVTNGFAMIRPPGHHASEEEFNGYSVFNNVAIAASSALKMGVNRILIVDWDVHHGQGTQRMFYEDPRVLYFSIHRYEYGNFWPNLRESDYDFIGNKEGEGYNVNVPLNQTGMGDSDYMAILNQLLLPIAYEYSPELIIISSGYDAALGCPEGEMMLTPAMYAHMTHHLSALASGRVGLVLEGGYCIKSLSEGCALTLRSLLNDPCPMISATKEPSDSIVTTILNVVKVLQPFWLCFDHYGQVFGEDVCPFEGVNTMPPVENVEFMTPCNRPSKFEIYGFYPTQTPEVIQQFSDHLDQLKASTNLSVANTKCCYVFDAEMRAHKNIFFRSHPERPDRISSIFNKLNSWGLLSRCLNVPTRLARKSELLLIHTESYIEDIKQTQRMDHDELEKFPAEKFYPSIFFNQKTVHCGLLSCGGVLNVTEAVLTGQAQTGVAIVRPPGHHAESHKAMGFCFFNNVAIAAKFALKNFGLKRILILDWDVHHGNATQHQFYDDPSVLYISLHRYDNGFFFPGSPDAGMNNVGSGPGLGYNVNIPWSSARMGDSEYLTAFTQIVMPIAYQYAPELVLVSAGFDAAIGDPLGGYKVTPTGYGHMTHMLKSLANGRVVLALEGGYNLNSISESMAVCTSVLLGDPCPVLSSLQPCARAMETINSVLLVQKEYWSCLKCKVCIPSAPLESRNRDRRPHTATMFGDRNSKTPIWSIPPVDKGQEAGRLPSSFEALNTDAVQHGQEPQQREESSSNVHVPSSPADLPTMKTEVDKAQGVVESTCDESISVQNHVFQSTVYSDEPDEDELITIFTTSMNMEAGKEGDEPVRENDQLESKSLDVPRGQGQEETQPSEEEKERPADTSGTDGVNGQSSQSPGNDMDGNTPGGNDEAARASGMTKSEDDDGAVGGACGGSSSGQTVEEFLMLEGVSQMYAVQPIPWCPHLVEVKPLPSRPLDVKDPCGTCGDEKENWVCLTCYNVECSRYVQEHMLYHKLETDHNMCLSYSDLSVWCYSCDQYVDNQILQPMKSAAHLSKFGARLP